MGTPLYASRVHLLLNLLKRQAVAVSLLWVSDNVPWLLGVKVIGAVFLSEESVRRG